jgi:hypothetical protein
VFAAAMAHPTTTISLILSPRMEVDTARALLLAHNFRVQEEIGRGTFAQVFAATCLERCVANPARGPNYAVL